MRIATGGICHETNGFGSILVTPEVMAKAAREGKDWWATHGSGHSYGGGFATEAAELGIELIATCQATLGPSGPITREAFEGARDRLVELLYAAYQEQPYDAIALSMHGAGFAEGYPDLEYDVLRAIREKLGYDIPIGVSLDLHGNISAEMVELADLVIGCKHYPHLDEYDTGRLVVRRLRDMVENNYRPFKKIIRLPWHLAPSQGLTMSGMAHEVQQQCFAQEEADDVFHVSFFHGFPFGDVPACGVSVIAMGKTQEAADRSARAVASFAWERRRDFFVPLHSAEEAVDLAMAEKEGPVILNEGSDNPGGGAPADGTFLLRELLKRNVSAAFGFIRDPEVAEQAAKAGVGAHISCRLGGKTDKYHGEPIEIEDAYVKCVSDGVYVNKSPMGLGHTHNMGTSVCLEVGNVSISVGTNRFQTMDDGPFYSVGIDWKSKHILAMKSAQHFKGWWADKVKAIYSCDSPGIHCSDLSLVPFSQADTSYFPLQDAQWDGE